MLAGLCFLQRAAGRSVWPQHRWLSASTTSEDDRESVKSMAFSSAALRKSFVEHFGSLGHRVDRSVSLIPPAGDGSLLFTTAGMVPFKNNFLAQSGGKVCSVQRCLRAGGKHNDIEDVGLTARHLTFFEMLGNFSFGDYGKAEAIDYAWRYLTEVLGLERDRLRVTAHEDDPETQQLWHDMFGLKTIPLRDDNWWSLGDDIAGLPAGFCTEIFYDTQLKEGDAGPMVDRWVEVWNLVFMQFRTTGVPGKLEPLGRICVDTGMGLERLAATMQGKSSSFEIDTIAPLVRYVWRLSGRLPSDYNPMSVAAEPVSARIIADHLRSACFLLADGVIPSPNDRGYVLRRLLRRAFAVAQVHLGVDLCSAASTAVLTQGFVELLVSLMGEQYPHLAQHQQRIEQVLANELKLFSDVVSAGMAVLMQKIGATKERSTLSSEFVFRLHDTLGFPIDMTRAIADKRGIAVDVSEVEALMNEQRERGRVSWKTSSSSSSSSEKGKQSSQGKKSQVDVPAALIARCKSLQLKTTFTGYGLFSASQDPKQHASSSLAGQLLYTGGEDGDRWVAIEPCPFYPRGGGQVGDKGTISIRDGQGQLVQFEVVDTVRPVDGCIALCIRPRSGTDAVLDERAFDQQFPAGSAVTSDVLKPFRLGAARNHSATHLLRSALCQVLGETVQQAGSSVNPDKLRFDFSFTRSLTREQIQSAEQLVNEWIERDLKVDTFEEEFDAALGMGAVSLAGEAYQSNVRVVRVHPDEPVSLELCGGTHVESTGQIGLFKILSESSTAAGIRRIEAVTGTAALNWLREQAGMLKSLANLLGVASPYGVQSEVERLIADKTESARQIAQMKALIAQTTSQAPLHVVQCNNNDAVVLVYDFDPHVMNFKALRKHADTMWPRKTNEIHILLSGPNFICLVSPESNFTTPNFISTLFTRIKGVGGGGPHLAQGRFETLDGLAEALRELPPLDVSE